MRRVIHSRHAATLVACTTAYFGIRIGQIALSPLVPAVTAALDVSTVAVGIAFSGMWFAYAATQIPSSLLSARVGPRATVSVALAIVVATLVVVAAAPTEAVFVLAVVILGAGAGLYYNAAASLLAREFSSLGSALGIHKLGSRAAGLVAPALAAGFLAHYGWRVVPVAAGGIAIVSLGIVRVGVSWTPPTGDTSPVRLRELFAPLAQPLVTRTTVLTATGEFVEQATMSFLPTALVVRYGLDISAASAFFALYFVIAALIGPVTGRLADTFDAGVGALAATVSGTAGFAALALGAPPVVAVIFTGASMGWTAPFQSRVLGALSDGDRDRGFGAYRTAYLLIGALGSGVVGAVATAVGWAAAFALLAALFGTTSLALVAER